MLQGGRDTAYLQEAAERLGGTYTPPPGPELWAELEPVVRVFSAMRSQWVRDASNLPALNYAALPVVEKRVGISPRQARRIFTDLRLMELEGRNFMSGG